MKMKSGWLFVAVMLPVLLAAACGRSDSTPKTQSYRNDGYLGITNTNPNLQNGPSYHTYQVDTDMMHQAVRPISGVRKVRVATNGANASVKLTVAKGTSAEEMERIRGEAMQALQHAVPRYDYKITMRSE